MSKNGEDQWGKSGIFGGIYEWFMAYDSIKLLQIPWLIMHNYAIYGKCVCVWIKRTNGVKLSQETSLGRHRPDPVDHLLSING